MARYLILAQSKVTAKALRKWLELLGQSDKKFSETALIVSPEVASSDKEASVRTYEYLVGQIEELASDTSGGITLSGVTILVDTVKPHRLNPLAEGGWDHLLSMLILTFPEIHWVFGMISSYPKLNTSSGNGAIEKEQMEIKESWDRIETFHSLPSLLTLPDRVTYFDTTALRNFVRRIANLQLLTAQQEKSTKEGTGISEKTLTELKKSLLPMRSKAAAAIDEEINYAYFHAYIAYRFGYRSDAVRSWALMEHLFHDTSEEKKSHDFDLLLEDVNLNFPDKPGSIHLSTFAAKGSDGNDGRAGRCNLLRVEKEDSRFRIIVTSGHSGADTDKMTANFDFIKGYKGREKCGYVSKPVGGMFDLWKNAKLYHRLNPRENNGEMAGRYNGQAPGFFWPPLPSEQAEAAGGHSAPGKLMLICQHLLRRADALRISANTVEECIRGAVLATDALEILRYQTPTLALQALCLKHEFEVKAEVAFLGVGHHFDLQHRMEELEREIKQAASFFEKKRRRVAELDTLVSIGNRLMLVFREAGQFDEEMDCLIRIRSWHRQLRRKQSRTLLDRIANGIVGYAEWLLGSPIRFVGMLLLWYICLWGLWGLTGSLKLWVSEGSDLVVTSAAAAWNSFVVTNPDRAKGLTELILVMTGSVLGIFHFGVFISYLYSAVSRK